MRVTQHKPLREIYTCLYRPELYIIHMTQTRQPYSMLTDLVGWKMLRIASDFSDYSRQDQSATIRPQINVNTCFFKLTAPRSCFRVAPS
ncbi:hypothetical protein GDO81_003455 [Engystomops pustulosus]|uniref:Uncharacterized protein n=1 Tax=Engystomops pustulosus TaxID=76066 RepID=A0AAV6ZWS4_ENGPU|nr:hypothetical protein GDO81_003455 [Engystomops pustulosus]